MDRPHADSAYVSGDAVSHRARLVIVAAHLPLSGIGHAGGDFLLEYVRSLQSAFDVIVLAPGTTDLDDVSDCPVPAHLLPIPADGRGLPARAGRWWSFAFGGLHPGAGWLDAMAESQEFQQAVRSADLVEIQWSQMLPLLDAIVSTNPQASRTAILHDVRAEVLRRRAVTAPSMRERLSARLALQRVARQEVHYCNMCAAVRVFKQADADRLRAAGVSARIEVIDPYLDFPPSIGSIPADDTVLYVGAFDRKENAEAAQWFVGLVWPRVLEKRPRSRLVLAGARPTPLVRALSCSTVEVTGFVPDLAPYYRGAACVVAPLLSGAGLKFKVPQAMAYGRPVVATPIAAEGLPATDDVLVVAPAEPSAFAAAVVGLLSDRTRSASVGRASAAWVRKTFNFESAMTRVIADYRELSTGSAT